MCSEGAAGANGKGTELRIVGLDRCCASRQVRQRQNPCLRTQAVSDNWQSSTVQESEKILEREKEIRNCIPGSDVDSWVFTTHLRNDRGSQGSVPTSCPDCYLLLGGLVTPEAPTQILLASALVSVTAATLVNPHGLGQVPRRWDLTVPPLRPVLCNSGVLDTTAWRTQETAQCPLMLCSEMEWGSCPVGEALDLWGTGPVHKFFSLSYTRWMFQRHFTCD